MATKKQLQEQLGAAADSAAAEKTLQSAGYEKSQAVLDAEKQLSDYEKNKPGEYVSGYQARIDSLLDQIEHRGGFSYDFNADPLYQAYKDQYAHNGRMAMRDAEATAQAATGGYGSSYAAAAGSQTYQNYLSQENDKLPELYEAALSRWNAEGGALQDQLSGLTTQEKNAHAAYEDTVADYYKGLSAYSGLVDSTYKKDYGEYQDLLASMGDVRDFYAGQEEQQFKNEMSRKDYELALQKYQENIREWEAEQAAARQKWQAQLAEQQSEFAQQMAYKASQAAKTTTKSTAKSTAASRKTTTAGADKKNTKNAASSAAGSTKKKAGYTAAYNNSAAARWHR